MVSAPKPSIHLIRLAVLLACFGTSMAHASYTVIDDDLLPTAVVEARKQAATTDQYDIPFAKNSIALGPLARRTIDVLIPSLQSASIKIIGRPDAAPNGKALSADGLTQQPLATSRAAALKQYLIRQGIPASNIAVTVDESPNPQPAGSNYPSQIVILGSPQRLPATDAIAYTQEPIQTPAIAPAAPTRPSVTPSNNAPAIADRDQLIRFINSAVQAGTMDAGVAVTLISRVLLNEHSSKPIAAAPTPQASQTGASAPATAPVANIIATPALARKSSWTLDKGLTLRDNINVWLKTAGWNPSQWEAANYFQVMTTSTIEGEFPDILRQIADSTGLNICVKKAQKIVRITDATIPCDKE